MKGTRLAGYEIIDKLGEGGMGEVWRARDEQLGRVVAIKVLPADLSGDPDRRARFEHEARALAALNHPNIVSVFGAGEYEGRSFIVSASWWMANRCGRSLSGVAYRFERSSISGCRLRKASRRRMRQESFIGI